MAQRDSDILIFTSSGDHPPGTVASLLRRGYAELAESDPSFFGPRGPHWAQVDQAVVEHPRTVGRCTFVSVVGGQPVGLGSYDPSGGPEVGDVGHNVIVPEQRGQGFGRAQLDEILRRIRADGLAVARATTSEHPFFAPARHMYDAAGFVEASRHPGGPDPRYQLIDYELRL